jgi:hypothetical protein
LVFGGIKIRDGDIEAFLEARFQEGVTIASVEVFVGN